MPADQVVEPFDVVEHIGPRGVARPVDFLCGPLGLESREEALHRRIVPDLAGAAHRTVDAIADHQRLELCAGVLGGRGPNGAAMQGNGSGIGSVGTRSEAARVTRRYAGDLGRRIREDGLLPGRDYRYHVRT